MNATRSRNTTAFLGPLWLPLLVRLIPLLIIVLAVNAAQDVRATKTTEETSHTVEPESARPAARPASHPLVSELQGVLDGCRVKMAGLKTQLDEADSPEAILSLNKAIEAAKLGLEVELFRAQIRYAEARGDGELARTLQGSVDAILERHPEIGEPDPPRETG